MFNPSRDQARLFFIDAWSKRRDGGVLTPLETLASDLVALHPEYHQVLENPAAAGQDFAPEDGQVNPFLHLSLHLAIEEQLSINQPPGIRAIFEASCVRHGNRHDALHDLLDCLGETVWRAQRDKAPLDAAAYLDCARQRAGIPRQK